MVCIANWVTSWLEWYWIVVLQTFSQPLKGKLMCAKELLMNWEWIFINIIILLKIFSNNPSKISDLQKRLSWLFLLNLMTYKEVSAHSKFSELRGRLPWLF